MKIVSGGQTGVDRAALDAALAAGAECGGWCPLGRRAEDGRIPARYPLVETASADYLVRTEWNVRDSDATLVINLGRLGGGTRHTVRFARALGRPVLVMQLEGGFDAGRVRAWLRRLRVRVLNVAGPRASKAPRVYALAYDAVGSLVRRAPSARASSSARAGRTGTSRASA